MSKRKLSDSDDSSAKSPKIENVEEPVQPPPPMEPSVVPEVVQQIPPAEPEVVPEEEEEQEPNLTNPNYPTLDMPFKVSERASDVGLKMYEGGERKLVVNRERTGTYMDGQIFDAEDELDGEYTVPKQVLADMAQWANRRHADTYYYGTQIADSALVFLNVETLLAEIREDLQSLIGKIRSARDEGQGLEAVTTVGSERGLLDRIKTLVEGIQKSSVLDPIDVSEREGGGYTIVNGNHRIIASMYRNLARIPARVVQE